MIITDRARGSAADGDPLAAEGAGRRRRLAATAQEVTREISQAGGTAVALRADVSAGVEVDKMVAEVVSQLGPVDVLVNNAAIADGDDVLEIDEPTWDRDVSVVLKSVFLCSKAVLPSMIERRTGVIVNITSVNGMSALGNEAYSAAKAGVINLTQGIAVRYGSYGIRCNAIAPGTIRTPIWQERVDRDPVVFQRLVKWYVRPSVADDIANACSSPSGGDGYGVGAPRRGDFAGNNRMTRELLAQAGGEEIES